MSDLRYYLKLIRDYRQVGGPDCSRTSWFRAVLFAIRCWWIDQHCEGYEDDDEEVYA